MNNAYLREAHLEQARLQSTRLEGAYLPDAHLDGADLRNAFLDSATNLEGATLGDEKLGFALLADVHWGDVNLSLINWRRVKVLGDDNRARFRELRLGTGTEREKGRRLKEYQAAVRANRQLANVMREQGMNEEAIRFAHRAQVLQRKVFWWQMLWGELEFTQTGISRGGLRENLQELWWRIRNFGACVFSWVLDILAGYGYSPGRSLLIYLLVITGFAAYYFGIGHLSVLEAFIFSVTSFHGRGFLPGPFDLSSPVTGMAALEAVLGLIVEISFITTFTQRFFGK